MGTACSCARDASDECARADKTNGHVPDQDGDGDGGGQRNGPLHTAEHATQTGRKNGAIPKISIGVSSVDGHSGYDEEEAGLRPMVSPALTTSATPPLTSPALATPPYNSPALTTPSMTPSAFVTSPLTSPPASSLRADSGVDQGRCDEGNTLQRNRNRSLGASVFIYSVIYFFAREMKPVLGKRCSR